MSFSMTTPQMYRREKEVTRRLGWGHLKAGDVVMADEKCMGLKKGEKVKNIGPIRCTENRSEPLRRMLDDEGYGWSEVIKEGFADLTPVEFVEMFCKANACTPDRIVNRVAFEFMEEKQNAY